MEIIILILLVLLIGAFCTAGWVVNNKTVKPTGLTYQETRDGLIEAGFCTSGELDSYKFINTTIKSKNGYDLSGLWLPQEGAKKTIIIVHGFTMNALASVRYVDVFLSKGFNILMYDHRYHGKSGGDSCTMGYYEQGDLCSWIDWVTDRVGEGSEIGLHGESMGASTSIIATANNDKVSFVIADCGFADLWDELEFQLKGSTKLPVTPLLHLADFFNRIRTGSSYRAVSPIKCLENIHQPIMFVHGDNDKVTPCSDSVAMYEKYKGKKQIFIVKGGNHADSIKLQKAEYIQEVHRFLDSFSS